MRAPMALRLHDENDRNEFFFAYCVSNFECWFLFRNPLDKAAILSYNTTPAEEVCGVLCSLLLDFIWPHSYHLFMQSWPHMSVGAFLLYSRCFSSLPEERFSSASATPKQDHISIIRHSDLTTSLTINRSGVHGDKSVREYEKAVFA